MKDLDLIEINEAFVAVGTQSTRPFGVGGDVVNGGATPLGQPVGACGARLAPALELAHRGGGQGEALILRVPASQH